MSVHLQLEAMCHRAAQRFDAMDPESEDGESMGFAIEMNSLKVAASTLVVDIVGRALRSAESRLREDSPFAMSRLLRDADGAAHGEQRPYPVQRPALARREGRLIDGDPATSLVDAPRVDEEADRGDGQLADAYASYRDELLAAGLLVATGHDGLYLRSEAFERIVRAIDAVVTAAARSSCSGVPLPPRNVQRPARAHRLCVVVPPLARFGQRVRRREREHAALLDAVEAGEDWSGFLRPTGLALCSAACHPLYPTQSGTLPSGGRTFEFSVSVSATSPAWIPPGCRYSASTIRLPGPSRGGFGAPASGGSSGRWRSIDRSGWRSRRWWRTTRSSAESVVCLRRASESRCSRSRSSRPSAPPSSPRRSRRPTATSSTSVTSSGSPRPTASRRTARAWLRCGAYCSRVAQDPRVGERGLAPRGARGARIVTQRLLPIEPPPPAHSLHRSDRCWTETNCYVDVWIEVLHALGLDPTAAGAFTLSTDFEGDQWTFFKFPPEDFAPSSASRCRR